MVVLPIFVFLSASKVQQQGFHGGKAAQELFRRWKLLLSEGGEELEQLQKAAQANN